MGSLGICNNDTSIYVQNVNNEKIEKSNIQNVGLIQLKQVGDLVKRPQQLPMLFTPLTIRGVTFHNRIFVSPMCMYSCDRQDGIFTDFHLSHYGNLAIRGPGLLIIEAAAIAPNARLSPQDAGIWGSQHVEPLRRIVNLAHAAGTKVGIQIVHGGRKAGTRPPYYMYEERGGKLGREDGVVPLDEGGFGNELVAPSPIPWKADIFPTPHELTISEIQDIIQMFVNAAQRAVQAGVDLIELHGAHGYLIHEFLSGNTNKRTDCYGGSLENRFRFLLEIIQGIRKVIPVTMPLFLRVSGTDYTGGGILSPDPNGWDIYQVIELCRQAVPLGLDFLDVSSGANVQNVKLSEYSPVFGFQVPLAFEVKKANIDGLIVGSVGSLHDGLFSEQVLQDSKTDVILIGRQFLKDPSLVFTMAENLGIKVRWPLQYSWMWKL